MDDIWTEAAFPGCFLLLPRILLLSRFVVIRHVFSPATSSLPLLSSPLFPSLSRPTRNPSPSSSTTPGTPRHPFETPVRITIFPSALLQKRVHPPKLSPRLAPPLPRSSRFPPPPRAASSLFRALIRGTSRVSVPSVVAPSYAVGGIAKLSRWLIPSSSSSSSPLLPHP